MSEIGLTEEECLVCDRIGTERFYKELRDLGLSAEKSREILKTLAQVYFADHIVLAGRKAGVIKGAIVFLCYTEDEITRTHFADIFGVTPVSIRDLAEKILETVPFLFLGYLTKRDNKILEQVYSKVQWESIREAMREINYYNSNSFWGSFTSKIMTESGNRWSN